MPEKLAIMEKAEPQVTLSVPQLESMFMRLIEAMRTPPVDPIKQLQKERERKQRDIGLAEMWKRRAEKRRICLHSRPDGTCVIGWAKQSEDASRGDAIV